MTRPYCVGLTGGLAAGKSAVAARLAELGAEVVDTDAIGRQLTGPQGSAMAAIARAFGPEVVAADGGLDRPAMRRRVFADGAERRRLEAILHPLIRDEARRRLATSRAAYVVLVVPLLVETGPAYRDLMDRVLVVDCPESAQLDRAMDRDGMDEALARAMLAAQAGRQARLAVADDVLDNSADLADLSCRVADLHARYLNLARQARDSLP